MSWCPTLPYSWSPNFLLGNLETRQASVPKEKSFVEARTPLGTLLEGLEGSRLVIPSIEALSPAWKVDINPHLESIRGDYNSWVIQWFKDEKIRRKISALNADGFAAMGYPRTGRSEVLNLSRLIAWYFPWDDGLRPRPDTSYAKSHAAIDDAAMLQQPANVMRYRDETIQLVKEALLSDRQEPSKPSSNPAIQSFWDIGTSIRSKGSSESNQRFAEQQCLFVASSAQSQIDRKSDTPVTVEQYLRRREDNIAIHPLMELTHYAYQVEVPGKWRPECNEQMSNIWKEVAWMGTMVNDLLSLRRELIQGQFESLVPLLMYHHELKPQETVDRGTAMIHESYERFYHEEQRLYQDVDPEHLNQVKECVQVYKDLIMCNLHWSYGLKRYMDSSMVQGDGTVVFDIRLPGRKKLP